MKILRLEVFENDNIKPDNPARPGHCAVIVPDESKGLRLAMLPGGAVIVDWGDSCPEAKKKDLMTLVGAANVKNALIVLDESEKAKFFK